MQKLTKLKLYYACTYNQNTNTLLYKLQRRDESKEQSVNITYFTYLERLSAQSRQSFFLRDAPPRGSAPECI